MAFGLRRTPPPPAADPRRDERERLQMRATIRLATGEQHEVTVENLSVTGFGAIGAVDLTIGTLFRIGLMPGKARHARVVWREKDRIGCEFLAPLTPDNRSLMEDAADT